MKMEEKWQDLAQKCKCANPDYGFDCVCDWMDQFPGGTEYVCEFCGFYTASKPRCAQCEEVGHED